MTIVNSQKGTIFAALIAPLFVLALPIIDTTIALVRRGLRGLPLFRADRGHIHHRMLETGLSHRKVVLCLYSFTAFFLLLGFVAFWLHGQHFAMLTGIAFSVVVVVAWKISFSREWFSVGRILGNSLTMRAEIQYALAQTRWLTLEATRTRNLESLCQDTVFIARKMGFVNVRIRLEDGEKNWQLISTEPKDCYCYRHKLPGQRYCFLELSASREAEEKTSSLLSELLAEGWIKSLGIWKKQWNLPLRFDGRETPPQTPDLINSTNLPQAAA